MVQQIQEQQLAECPPGYVWSQCYGRCTPRGTGDHLGLQPKYQQTSQSPYDPDSYQQAQQQQVLGFLLGTGLGVLAGIIHKRRTTPVPIGGTPTTYTVTRGYAFAAGGGSQTVNVQTSAISPYDPRYFQVE